jgi:hypothetical protein
MLVYHGSYLEIKNPDINYVLMKLDFGKGFYVSTLQAQAEKWSRRRSKLGQKKPVVSVYEFNTDILSILSFDGYTDEWLDFVVQNRSGSPQAHSYDAIYGNIANDDVASVVNDYIRLLRMGRINQDGKKFYLGQLQYSNPNNQYCIATEKGINALQFIKSYTLEG